MCVRDRERENERESAEGFFERLWKHGTQTTNNIASDVRSRSKEEEMERLRECE